MKGWTVSLILVAAGIITCLLSGAHIGQVLIGLFAALIGCGILPAYLVGWLRGKKN